MVREFVFKLLRGYSHQSHSDNIMVKKQIKYENLIRIFVLICILNITGNIFSQNKIPQFPSDAISKFNQEALQRIKSENQRPISETGGPSMQSSAGTALKGKETLKLPAVRPKDNTRSFFRSDTLFIGDTMEVTGDWTRIGPVILYDNGYLYLNHCHATILGDIYLLNNARFVAESSFLYIPQAYFYQRAVVATGGSKVIYRDTEVDHSDLSHNILLIDSARLELINVVNKGFTTNGIYHHSSVYVDGINQAGEYVIVDDASLEFFNAKTVLLWHQFPEGAVVDFNFPDADTVDNYQFNESVPGVMGVGYSVLLENCTDVMWGMMPATGSDITISDSDIRAIGLWFMGTDTVDVRGLVNNSHYDNFQVPLDDRNLHLKNCEIMTWSIYPMDQSVVNLSGCIVGEVGTGKRSSLTGSQVFCDGSGGYVWTSDTSFMLIGFSAANGYVRSQSNSILYYAYSSLIGGYPSALHNSVIIAIQCTLPEEPRALDNGVAWYALIESPSDAYTGDNVDIKGSAWIDKASVTGLMDFHSYHLYYQESDSQAWTEILADSLNEKRRETLGTWNTAGLDPGQYLLKLVLIDDLGNSVEGLKAVSLLPSFGILEDEASTVLVYPNPVRNGLTLHLQRFDEHIQVTFMDQNGRICFEQKYGSDHSGMAVYIPLDFLHAGVYYLSLLTDHQQEIIKTIIKQ